MKNTTSPILRTKDEAPVLHVLRMNFTSRYPDPLDWVRYVEQLDELVRKHLDLIDDYFDKAEKLERTAASYRETAAYLRARLAAYLPTLWPQDQVAAAKTRAAEAKEKGTLP